MRHETSFQGLGSEFLKKMKSSYLYDMLESQKDIISL